MVVVHKSVPTLLVATHVDVTLDMSWMEMDSLAMVRVTIFWDMNLYTCTKTKMLMNVQRIVTTAQVCAPTQKVAMCVDVPLAMS